MNDVIFMNTFEKHMYVIFASVVVVSFLVSMMQAKLHKINMIDKKYLMIDVIFMSTFQEIKIRHSPKVKDIASCLSTVGHSDRSMLYAFPGEHSIFPRKE